MLRRRRRKKGERKEKEGGTEDAIPSFQVQGSAQAEAPFV
jgi:hypothetical protein